MESVKQQAVWFMPQDRAVNLASIDHRANKANMNIICLVQRADKGKMDIKIDV